LSNIFPAIVDFRFKSTILENEARLLKEALDQCGWNKKQAPRRLGISRNTLDRKLNKYEINPSTIHWQVALPDYHKQQLLL
jgi:DNA-binding NtrC family response regulator